MATEGSLWPEPKRKCLARAKEWGQRAGDEATDWVKK